MKFVLIAIVLIAVAVLLILRNKPDKPKTQMVSPQDLSYSQLDITENFGDNLSLKPDDWIETSPLNMSMDNPESVGLPPKDADTQTVYEVAVRMSEIREQIPIPSDGVYCPICHIANIEINKLHTPCPRCGRNLLKFGWD